MNLKVQEDAAGKMTDPLSPPETKLDPRLQELADATNASTRIQNMGGKAEILNGCVALLKNGHKHGEWSIYDSWFEYQGHTCAGGQIHRAAWFERALTMTCSILEGVAVTGCCGASAEVLFRASEIDGFGVILVHQLVGGEFPNLGVGQLTLVLRHGTDSEEARRIARQLSRDVVGLEVRTAIGTGTIVHQPAVPRPRGKDRVSAVPTEHHRADAHGR